jgi:hypothetical protein
MAGKRPRPQRPLQLSGEAMSAAERLAELSGVPVPELLEIVLLELVESGTRVQARNQRKRPRGKTLARRGPANVVPIDRARRRPASALRQRVEALHRRSDAARARAEAARRASVDVRLRCRALRGGPVDW